MSLFRYNNTYSVYCVSVLLGLLMVSDGFSGNFTNYATYITVAEPGWPEAQQYDRLLDDLTEVRDALRKRCDVGGKAMISFDSVSQPGNDIKLIQNKIDELLGSRLWVTVSEGDDQGSYEKWFSESVVFTNWYDLQIEVKNHAYSYNIFAGKTWTNNSGVDVEIWNAWNWHVVTLAPGQAITNECDWMSVTNGPVTNIVEITTLLPEGEPGGSLSKPWERWMWKDGWVVLEQGTNYYRVTFSTNVTAETVEQVPVNAETLVAKWTIPRTVTNHVFLGEGAVEGGVGITGSKYRSAFPLETKAGMFSRLGIGKANGLLMDAWGFVTNGIADWSRLVYPDGGREYGTSGRRVCRVPLEECRRVLGALRYTHKANSEWTHPFRRRQSNSFIATYSGDESQTWEDVEVAVADRWQVKAAGHDDISGGVPYASIWKDTTMQDRKIAAVSLRVSNSIVSGLSTNYRHSADFYARAEKPYTGVFGAMNAPLIENRYVLWNTTIESYSDRLLSMETLDRVEFPSPWTDNPDGYGKISAAGYRVSGQNVLIKWKLDE